LALEELAIALLCGAAFVLIRFLRRARQRVLDERRGLAMLAAERAQNPTAPTAPEVTAELDALKRRRPQGPQDHRDDRGSVALLPASVTDDADTPAVDPVDDRSPIELVTEREAPGGEGAIRLADGLDEAPSDEHDGQPGTELARQRDPTGRPHAADAVSSVETPAPETPRERAEADGATHAGGSSMPTIDPPPATSETDAAAPTEDPVADPVANATDPVGVGAAGISVVIAAILVLAAGAALWVASLEPGTGSGTSASPPPPSTTSSVTSTVVSSTTTRPR